jgi:hypothetical protein
MGIAKMRRSLREKRGEEQPAELEPPQSE